MEAGFPVEWEQNRKGKAIAMMLSQEEITRVAEGVTSDLSLERTSVDDTTRPEITSAICAEIDSRLQAQSPGEAHNTAEYVRLCQAIYREVRRLNPCLNLWIHGYANERDLQ